MGVYIPIRFIETHAPYVGPQHITLMVQTRFSLLQRVGKFTQAGASSWMLVQRRTWPKYVPQRGAGSHTSLYMAILSWGSERGQGR